MDTADPSTPRRSRWPRTIESYAIGPFRWHQAAWVTSNAAMQMAQVSRPWLAFEISDSALALGLVAAAQGIPQILSSPFGGLAADRLPKRTVLLVSQLVLLGMFTTMALIVFLDVVAIWMLVSLALVHGVTIPFNNPVRQSYIPTLLPRELLPNGVAVHASVRNLNQVLVPSIAGVLLQIQPSFAFISMVGLHLVSTAFGTRLPQAPAVESKSRGVRGELFAGVNYSLRHPVLRLLLLLVVLAQVFGLPYQHLLPVFQNQVLEVGPSHLGFMYTSLGAGALVSSLVLATFSVIAKHLYMQLLVGILFGTFVVLFALSDTYLLSLGLLFVVGFGSQAFGTLNSTQIALYSDPSYYGRLFSFQSMIRSLAFIMVLPFGALIDVYGPQVVVAGGGAIFAAGVVMIGATSHSFWRSRT